MNENQQILREQFSKLPQLLRNFVSKGNWSGIVSDIAKKFNITEENYALFENEVLFVLIGLQPKENFAENIKKELLIDTNMAGWVAEDVEKNIFSKVTKEIDEMWQVSNDTELAPHSASEVGSDFEQIISNQARAMQPAFASPKPSGEGGLGYGVAKPAQTPSNLPTGEQKVEESKKIIHNYMGGGDPYREPIE